MRKRSKRHYFPLNGLLGDQMFMFRHGTDGSGGSGSGDGTGGTGGAGEGSGADNNKFYTKVELEAIIKDRLARDRKRFEGYDDYKKKAEEYDKLQDEKLSESERFKKEAAESKEREEKALSEAKKIRLDAAIEVQAAKLGFVDTNDALTLVDRTIIVENDNGFTGVKETLEKLLESKPYLKGEPAPGSTDVGSGTKPPGGGGGSNKSIDEQIQEAEKAGDILTAIHLKSMKTGQVHKTG